MTISVAIEPRSGGGRLLFISGLGVGQIVSWGTIYYAFPVVADRMASDLSATRADMYGAATVAFLLAALVAYPVGAWVDRGHGRRVMAGGALLSIALLLAWSRVSSLFELYAIFAGLGVAQALCLYEPAFAVVARRYGADARQGITALTLWGGFASTVFVPLTDFLAARLGWRDAIATLAAINVVLALIPYLLVIRKDLDTPAQTELHTDDRGPVREALRMPSFWGLLLAFTAYYAAFSALTYHLYPLLQERGFDTAAVVAAMAMIGPAQVAGRIGMWALAARLSVARLGLVMFVALPLAITLLALLPTVFAWLAGWALLHGAINGVMTIVRGMAVPELVTRRGYGAVNGLLAAPSNLVKALAPMGAAVAWQIAGNYGPVMLGCIGLGVVGALAFGFAAAKGQKPR